MKNNTSFYLVCFLVALCGKYTALGQPVANFTAAPITGCAPLAVQFIDNSTGAPTSWNWDFGNGKTSLEKNPSTTYLTAGIYNVKLIVTNASGVSTLTQDRYITVYDKPAVNFTGSDSSNCVPFTTTFTDLSSVTVGNITSWLWIFDDGTSSTLPSPQHLYDQPGNYPVTLSVTSSGGCSNLLTKQYINAQDAIQPRFSFSAPVKCKAPETINFTNSSAVSGTMSYLWDFGDGSTSALTSPSHNYLSGGVYSITLIAKNNIGCTDTLTYKDTLNIRNVQAVILGPDTVCAEKPFIFSNGTIPAGLTSIWRFTDNSSAFGNSITKLWPIPGTYSVTLISNSNICSDSVTKPITVRTPPIIDFTASDTAACRPPLSVNFTDISSGGVSWNWHFGDTDSSAEQNPTHTYNGEGEFTVNLVITDRAGCSSSVSKESFIKVLKPSVSFNNREGGGCIPYTFQPLSTSYAPDGIASYFWDFGNGETSTSATPSANYPDTGRYRVKLVVTTNEGCTDSSVMINAVRTGTPPTVDFGAAVNVACPGTNIQFTDLSFPADRWLWNFGEGSTSTTKNPVHQFFDTITRSVKLTAWNNGCSDTIRKNAYIKALPGLARFRAEYNCSNKKEVTFKDSSILPQSYLWDFGDGTTSTQPSPTHQFPDYQNYNVSLTTTSDTCTNKKTITVSLLNEIPDFTASDSSLCTSQNTNFRIVNVNKSNVKNYLWDFGDGSISDQGDSINHSYANAGSYSVTLTITDNHGCIETVSKTNLIQVFSPRAGFRINGLGGCLNKNVSFIDTSITSNGINNIAQWFWDFGDGTTQNFTAPPSPVLHSYSRIGSYYPSLIIVDSAGCSDTAFYTVPVKINNPIANFFASNFNTCIVDTVIFRNPSTGNSLTHLWDFGDGTFSTALLPRKQYAVNGDFTTKLVITDQFGCKDSMTRLNYIKVRTVSASFTMDDSVGTCIPFKVNFTNSSLNSTSQIWNFGDGSLSTDLNTAHSYPSPGIFQVKLTARRSTHCISYDSANIKITAPTGTLTYSPLEGCSPLNVTFHGTSSNPVNFRWDFGDGVSIESTDSNTTHVYTTAGNFAPILLLFDSTGCIVPVVGKDTIKIYNSKVNFAAIDTVLCAGDIAYFSDSSSTGSTITSYRWDFGDGSFSTEKNPPHYYDNPGIYSVKLVTTTIYGCQDSIVKPNYIKVANRPQVRITANDSSWCGPSTVTFMGDLITADTSAINWAWIFGNGSNSTLQNPPSQTYNDTGIYVVQLSATNSSGCAGTAQTNISILPVPNTFAGKDTTICLGSQAQLLATGADSFTWQPAAFLSCTNCNNPISTIQNDGNYFVKGTNANGCEKTDSIFIRVKKPFSITGLEPLASICSGKSIQLNVSGAENYSWSPVLDLSNSNTSNPVASPSASTVYKVTGFDSSNCFKDSAAISITVNANPSVNAGADIILNAGRSITFTPQYSNDIISWLWQPPTGLTCTDCANPVAQPADNTTYVIKVTNSSGCTASDEIFVEVKCDKSIIFLPTAFSPNNDDRNEVFYPINPAGTGIFRISTFSIFDRYGNLVFQNGNFYSNDRSKGWDGKYLGRDMPIGAYVYTIEFICSNNKPVVFNGNILLLR